jgi:hypothetical protein
MVPREIRGRSLGNSTHETPAAHRLFAGNSKMATGDWTTVSGAMAIGSDVAAGMTSGVDKPNGGGAYCYVARSLAGAGVFALRATPASPNTGFDPMAKGGEISAALKASSGAAPFLFFALQAPTVGATAYTIGLDPTGRIRFAKTALDGSSASVSVTGTRVYAPGTWVHLRLEVVANTNGDVIVNAGESDLAAHPVDAPSWTPVEGFSPIGGPLPSPLLVLVDDVAAVNSGSLPLVGGRAGFGARFSTKDQRAGFDQIFVAKQL